LLNSMRSPLPKSFILYPRTSRPIYLFKFYAILPSFPIIV
jgi:hypothetical protein